MSEFKIQVVRLGKIGKHPNADTLSITQVLGNYPVVLKSGTFQPGDLAVHIPPDSLVPVDHPAFSFLANKATNGFCRIRFSKIRNVPSYGFLVPLSDVTFPEQSGRDLYGQEIYEGMDVQELLGVQKYEPGPCYQLGGEIAGEHISLPQGGVVPHYDIFGLRKYERLFEDGERVIVTEKIHGSNGRWIFLNDELYCGSRTRFRRDSVWNRMAEKYDLKATLEMVPGIVLYGEVYGSKIQDLTYGIDDQRVVFFDIYDTRTGTWWDSDRFRIFCRAFNLPAVPVLYDGPFELDRMYEYAEGGSILHMDNYAARKPGCAGNFHVREGIVVRPAEERWDQRLGRVFLKLPGEGYLLRKQAA